MLSVYAPNNKAYNKLISVLTQAKFSSSAQLDSNQFSYVITTTDKKQLSDLLEIIKENMPEFNEIEEDIYDALNINRAEIQDSSRPSETGIFAVKNSILKNHIDLAKEEETNDRQILYQIIS